ncbi:PHD and RING finger domain-containing protein 1 [Hyperolius riggenbachi]|uniref:PHD and RING finger domain-containing protein 1 n=1 Tax=Hyperolius riggenbachi TaxID=752182 RepID=UPI0035A28021
MDDEENQDQLIGRNNNGQQGPFVASDDEDSGESEQSGTEGEEEDGEEEDGSDSEEEEDEDEEDVPLENSGSAVPATDVNDGLISDDQTSDEERENCPICLNGFRDQVVGTPENCNHYFCLDCILEWSKNANSCPVDRITFSCIHIRAHYGGDILKKVPVHNKAGETAEEEDATNCEVCGQSDREDRLLLCDGCDAGYHMECLTPALNAIPVDEWFCPECAPANQQDEVSEEEVQSLLADVVPTTSRLRGNVVRTRAIARTRQSERVRANVNRIRTTARTSQNVPRFFLSSLLDETIEAVVAGLNTAVYTRNLTPRPATTRRKRRTVKKGQSKGSKGGRAVGKRRKRRVKKRRGRKQTARKPQTSHGRIARSLGLCNPPRGSTLPRVQREPEQTLGSMRGSIGAASLSVFGNPFDLDPIDSNEDPSSAPSSPLTAKRRILSRSALRSHQPVARPISVGLSRGGEAPLAPGSVAVAEPVPDLLGSILSGQSMLMMKGSDIIISRDGSLTAKKLRAESSQRKSIESAPSEMSEPSPTHSGSPTTLSSVSTWKPIERQSSQPSFHSPGLYSLSPSPPLSSSPSGCLERLSGSTSPVLGGPSFRLKNAFTPRVVQVQSSANRISSKAGEPSRFNGTFHKSELPSSNDHIQPKRPELKLKPPELRLDISEFPRIPKIKRETDNNPNREAGKQMEPSTSSSDGNSSGPTVNQLTGRGESKQLGKFTTTENTERSTRHESQTYSRNTGSTSSSQSASSGSKTSPYSNSSRNAGSSDPGGGGLRITISASSSNSCRQFSPIAKDPFRTSDGKAQQKSSPLCSTTIKKEKTVKNEIYDPFDPTGSDSGSPNSSPERPATPPPPPPPPPPSTEIKSNTVQSSGVKVGKFRSFKLTSHSSKVAVSKLGPDFSGLSPTNKEEEEPKSQTNASPALSSFLKLEKEIKKEVIEEETNEHPPFRITCPLGLKITSDLKSGGIRGFHFDVEDENHEGPVKPVKPDPDVLPERTFRQSISSSRQSRESESRQSRESESRQSRESESRQSRESESRQSRESESRQSRESESRQSRESESWQSRESESRQSRESESRQSRESESRQTRESENSPETTPFISVRVSETQKKKVIKEELKGSSSSSLRAHSRDLDSGTHSLPTDNRERKYKSKSHKVKRARSDRSSSGSCERSKKKRQKERKKEKKRKRSESRERRRSRSSSRSSSSHRVYNSKKKKKKKRDSRSESPSHSISPDKERKRKHKTEKSYYKEGGSKTKEKKKSKEDRVKQRSKSPQIIREYKAHKSKDRTHFRDTEITRHIVLSPNNSEKTITCTVSFKTDSPTIAQETKKYVVSIPKQEDDERDPFLYSERKVSIKEEYASELSDQDENVKGDVSSPPWSPSLLDSLLPEENTDDVPELPSPQDASPMNEIPSGSVVGSPQDSPVSTGSDAPLPMSYSPKSGSYQEADQSALVLQVKKEADDLQWSPSHLDDLLLNDLSDDVCSVDAASPDDVDLEEAILMKGESDYKDSTVINFSKTTVIPFLQDEENSVEAEAGNHIDEKTSKSKALEEESKSEELEERESSIASISKSKPQIKRVTWNLNSKESEEDTSTRLLSPPFHSPQLEDLWSSPQKHTDITLCSYEPDPSSETSSPITWTTTDTPTQESRLPLVNPASWIAGNTHLTHIVVKPEETTVVDTPDRRNTQAPDRPVKEASQVPWIATETPLQVPPYSGIKVFPQTLPPLPLPPVFPPYAPVNEPAVPCVVHSSQTILSQTPKAGSLATVNESKMQAANTGEEQGKSKHKKGEKVKNEEYMKKLHIQERAVEEVKLAIKPFYQKREITKDEYKEILRKAVQKICHSKSGEINPVKVVNLVKGYVDKYKHIRNKSKKSGSIDDHFLGSESPI